MTRCLALALLVACGTTEPPPWPNPVPGCPIEGPQSADGTPTIPPLPELCVDGWCSEAQTWVGHVTSVFLADDALWFALPTHSLAIRGDDVTTFPAGHVPMAIGVSSTWRLEDETISHGTGDGWSTCTIPGLTSIAVRGEDDVWGARRDGSLVHFDGVVWGQSGDFGAVSSIEAIPRETGGHDVYAVSSSGLLRRGDDGAWAVDDSLPYAVGISGRSSDDVFAFGPTTHHFDGTTWRDTAAGIPLVDVCGLGSGRAIAISDHGLHHYDGASWTAELAQNTASGRVWCTDRGSWARLGTQLAERVGPLWRVSTTEDSLGRSAATPTGELWSAGTELGRHAGQRWTGEGGAHEVSLLPAGMRQFVDVGVASATEIYSLVEVRPTNAPVRTFLLRHNGTRFVNTLELDGVKRIEVIGPADVILVHADLRTERLRNGGLSVLVSGSAAAQIGGNTSELAIDASLRGWAVADDGRLLRFDGTSWTVDLSGPVNAAGLHMNAPDDVWTTAGPRLAHFTTSGWSLTPLPGAQPGENAIAVWGATPAELWVIGTLGTIWRVSGGVPSVLATGLPVADVPIALSVVAGTAANDVWFGGRVLVSSIGEPALYHWNGTNLRRHRELRNVRDIASVGGETFALDATRKIWEHTTAGWIERPDVPVASVFPLEANLVPPQWPHLNVLVGSAPGQNALWATWSFDPSTGTGEGHSAVIWRASP